MHFICELQGDIHLPKKGPLFAHKTLEKPGEDCLSRVLTSYSGHLCSKQTDEKTDKVPGSRPEKPPSLEINAGASLHVC